MHRDAPKLKDKVAVITGAGGGIGRAVAHLFAHHGASLGVFARAGMVFPRIFFVLFPILKKIG